MKSIQRVILFQSDLSGPILNPKRKDNLEEINRLLEQGWGVVSMSPTSSPSVSAGGEHGVFALVVLEKEGE